MDCKIIRTWILTDYQCQELEGHIKNCPACSNFLEEVKNPKFDKEYIWNKIKTKIEEEPQPAFNIFLERILQGLRAPKPIFAFSTCAALLIAVFVLTQGRVLYQKTYNRQSAAMAITEQLEYFASDETTSFATELENYFL